MEPENNNVTEFPGVAANQSQEITLDNLIISMNDWRANRGKSNEPIPKEIWEHVFKLSKKFPETTVCTALGITRTQYRRKLDEQQNPPKIASQESQALPQIDFCEAKLKVMPIYQPAKIPATNTLVVEFCRADGHIMKIHTTTDSFADLIKAFLKGE
jgi:hypothetical protein